jgi:MFS family permease
VAKVYAKAKDAEGGGRLSRSLVALSVTSLLNDVSSDMIFPLLPLFVTSVLGAGPAFFGLLDGVAESVSSVVKLVAGALSDRAVRRKPFVVAGYLVAVASRGVFSVATAPWHALLARLFDRAGKGIRTAPRDALLAATSPSVAAEAAQGGPVAARHGLTFGFHRAMDHFGGVFGGLIASGLLAYGVPLRAVFAAAALPGILAVLVLALFVVERPAPPETAPDDRSSKKESIAPGAILHAVGGLGPRLKALLVAVAVFTLGNSSDGFVMLLAAKLGIEPSVLPLFWTALHLVKGLSTLPGGLLSDRFGRRRVLLAGWVLYGAVYVGFAAVDSKLGFLLLTLAYGLHFGLTEGVVAALVADLAPADQRGVAFGAFHLTTGLGVLPASLVMGFVWQVYGAPAAFCFSAVAAWSGAGLLVLLRRR